jgi:hypothetical protein
VINWGSISRFISLEAQRDRLGSSMISGNVLGREIGKFNRSKN